MATQSTLSWNELDAGTLPQDVQDLYREYKEAYAVMKARRQQFEVMINEYALAEGKVDGMTTELACAYNFGKLSVAIAPKRERKAGRKAMSLGEIGQ